MTSWYFRNRYLPNLWRRMEGEERWKQENEDYQHWRGELEELYWNSREDDTPGDADMFWQALDDLVANRDKLDDKLPLSVREKHERFDEMVERYDELLERWEQGDHEAVWDELDEGIETRTIQGDPAFPVTWIPRRSSEGNRYWENLDTGEKRYQLEKPGDSAMPDPEDVWRDRDEDRKTEEHEPSESWVDEIE